MTESKWSTASELDVRLDVLTWIERVKQDRPRHPALQPIVLLVPSALYNRLNKDNGIS